VDEELEEKVIQVNRVSKVVKGGKRLRFNALVVVGDKKGHVGCGMGKSSEVAGAVRKAGAAARKNLIPVFLQGGTIPYQMEASFGAAKVLLKPASPGTGLVAGGGVRAVMELSGVEDVLSKQLGSRNFINVVQATMSALKKMEELKTISDMRRKERNAKS
jgi:small subunit ribosomal protein S5